QHVLDRAGGATREVLGHVGGVVEQPFAAFDVPRAREQAIEQTEQVVPARGRGEQVRQAFEGPLRVRVAFEDAREQAMEGVRIVAVPFAEERRRTAGERPPALAIEVSFQRLAIRLGDVVGTLEPIGERFDVIPGLVDARTRFGGFDGSFERETHAPDYTQARRVGWLRRRVPRWDVTRERTPTLRLRRSPGGASPRCVRSGSNDVPWRST